jgi:hypothetical protein
MVYLIVLYSLNLKEVFLRDVKIKTMKKSTIIVLLLISIIGYNYVNAQMIEHKYDFNNLATTNYLDGTDDWTTVTNQNQSPNPELDDWHIDIINKWSVVALDGSKYMSYDGENTNVGRTASRLTTDSLPFDFSIGGVMEIQVNIKRGYWKTYFGFGYDSNNNGITLKGVENTLQFEPNDGGIGIHLSQGNSQYNVFVLPDGSYIPLNINNDSLKFYWYTYKMIIDFDANGGAGSLSLSYKKNGEGNFVSCSSVANQNLGLTPGSGNRNDPAMWTKLLIHGTGLSCVDDIIIRQPNTGGLLYQYLIFDPIPDHLTTDPPFQANAISNQGLNPTFSIASGPATLSGNTITLTGQPGIVKVVASQPGDTVTAPAANDTVSFNVIDPYLVVPEIEILNPVNSKEVNAPGLDPVLLTASTNIDYDDLLSIKRVYFTVDANQIEAYPTNNGYYIAYWEPPTQGAYNLSATVLSDFDVSASESLGFDVVGNTTSHTFTLLDQVDFANVGTIDSVVTFPSFSGTYNQVVATLDYACPPSGCEPWDVVANVYITGANGQELKLFSYITPYGVACQDSIDVTDYVSQLQGNVRVRINFPAKSVITIKFTYYEGTPDHKFSWVDKLWGAQYPFGSMADPQPVPIVNLNLEDSSYQTPVKEAYLREMTTGHGWGDLNTGNAAEFRESTHSFKIDGNTEFTQHLWNTCNPNPVDCQPQNGTWYYNRSGWCPGSIPTLWRFDLTPRIGSSFDLMYEFDPTYTDLCSPYNPNCVTGVTCSDCDNMYNPVLIVAGELITYFDEPPIPNWTAISIHSPKSLSIKVAPNPSTGIFRLSSSRIFNKPVLIQIFNVSGLIVDQGYWNGEDRNIDLSGFAKGLYILKVSDEKDLQTKKLIVQ